MAKAPDHMFPPDGVSVAKDVDEQTILQLDPEERETFEEFTEVASKIKIMVTGPTGTGKSTLLNGLVGEKVFEASRKSKKPVTTRVNEHACNKNGIKIIALDCPGLHDGTDNEDMYIQEMFEKIEAHGGVDLILYCKRMTESRGMIDDEKEIMTKLTEKLGKEIWKYTLFVLTFANTYEEMIKQKGHDKQGVLTEFKRKKNEWKKYFRQAAKECKIRSDIKVCPAGYKQPQLGNSEYWLSDFWASAYKKIQNEEAAFALLQLSKSRMVEPEAIRAAMLAGHGSETFKRDLNKQPIVLTDKVKRVLGILGITVGPATFAGATVGATIGAVCIGVVSFGPAAGAGLVLGGVVGAAVGSAIGGTILGLYYQYKKKKLKVASQTENEETNASVQTKKEKTSEQTEEKNTNASAPQNKGK